MISLLFVSVSAAVTITAPPADTTVAEDEGTAAVTLTCTATGVPQPSISWSPGAGGRISIMDGAPVTDDEGTFSVTSNLTISSLVRGDAGSYTCIANNTVTSDSRLFTLSVNCELCFLTSLC